MSDADRILLLLPAVLTEHERLSSLERVRERYPDSRVVVWDQRDRSQGGPGHLIRLRTGRFRHCLIERGAAPIGYSRAKIIAACIGAPVHFEGKEFAAAALWLDLLQLAAYRVRCRWRNTLVRLVDIILTSRTAARPGTGGGEAPSGFTRAETFVYLRLHESAFGRRRGQLMNVRHGASRSDVARDEGWEACEIDRACLLSDVAGVDPPVSGPFDLVLALDAVDDVADPLPFLRRLRSACRPGGVVLLRCRDFPARAAAEAGFRVHHADTLLNDEVTEAWLVAADEDPH
ncbi:MAG: hypothetical protein HY321_05105 [Armatimonadetes bacterium]|nr:hypothetical protein [Armatimonadota bacterium]